MNRRTLLLSFASLPLTTLFARPKLIDERIKLDVDFSQLMKQYPIDGDPKSVSFMVNDNTLMVDMWDYKYEVCQRNLVSLFVAAALQSEKSVNSLFPQTGLTDYLVAKGNLFSLEHNKAKVTHVLVPNEMKVSRDAHDVLGIKICQMDFADLYKMYPTLKKNNVIFLTSDLSDYGLYFKSQNKYGICILSKSCAFLGETK